MSVIPVAVFMGEAPVLLEGCATNSSNSSVQRTREDRASQLGGARGTRHPLLSPRSRLPREAADGNRLPRDADIVLLRRTATTPLPFHRPPGLAAAQRMHSTRVGAAARRAFGYSLQQRRTQREGERTPAHRNGRSLHRGTIWGRQ